MEDTLVYSLWLLSGAVANIDCILVKMDKAKLLYFLGSVNPTLKLNSLMSKPGCKRQ